MPNELTRVPANLNLDELVRHLREYGGLILEDLITQEQVDAINKELAPHIESRPPGFKDGFDNSFYGTNTKRIQGLASKSPTFVEAILLNPILLSLADRILLKNCGTYWMSQAETIFIGPQSPSQELHRDDLNWGKAAELGIDLQISTLTAIGDYDTQVGATRIIPGSHRWSLDKTIDAAKAQPAFMRPGSTLVYLGSLVHGGGSNQTDNRWRKGLYCSYLLGWLTPEEASPLSLSPEIAKKLPQRARELLGWASLRGSPVEEGAAAALHLWQLDKNDLAKYNGLFRQS